MLLFAFFGTCLSVCAFGGETFRHNYKPKSVNRFTSFLVGGNARQTSCLAAVPGSADTSVPNSLSAGAGLRLPRPSPAQRKLSLIRDGKERTGSFFVCQLGGKQQWMERGRFYDVARLQGPPGSHVMLTRVTAYQSPSGDVFVGQPFLEQVRPIASILSHFLGPKQHKLKYKRKKRYRRLVGTRVQMSRIRVEMCVVQPESLIQSPTWRGYGSDLLFQLITLAERSPYAPGHHPTGGHNWPKSLIKMWKAANEYKLVKGFKLASDEVEPLLGFDFAAADRFSRLIKTSSASVSPYDLLNYSRSACQS